MDDTICAIATASGASGIAVIRVSGPQAIAICNQIFVAKNNSKALTSLAGYSICYGDIVSRGERIDETLVSLFRSPHSYTGEDTIEISCHGSTYIQHKILELLIENGCRLATPGEFTMRAFFNGKMDLSQAEAVADLITSTSAGMHKLAMSQMRGDFSRELSYLREQLVEFNSLIELELDFGEEDVEFADRNQLLSLATQIAELIGRLAESFSIGNVVKNGLPVAIIGEVNVGKSTLLNGLVGDDRAIVSDIPGTTRDSVEDVVNLSGIIFRFIDTAGIRPTSDEIERMGISRTFKQLEQAHIVLWVIDLTSDSAVIDSAYKQISPYLKGKKTILVFNKVDLLPEADRELSRNIFADISSDYLHISAQNGEDIQKLKQLLVSVAALPNIHSEDVIVTNLRHYEALIHAHEAIIRVIEGLNEQLTGDYISLDLRECSYYLGEITGEITTDEVLGSIFSRFCIGK
ncbi:MAG: tRNA uridine-5-carboxymethylaminomethyl(34) synthesis GTPase MnmE [Tannerellaceae bacterium]|nr:tRNA uridine-5-carboxymethylaminomethyl(34) synthesis GTPase MnmE [Tannerellaceae bacterium]